MMMVGVFLLKKTRRRNVVRLVRQKIDYCTSSSGVFVRYSKFFDMDIHILTQTKKPGLLFSQE